MAIFKPFKGIRPNEQDVKDVAALPYDVYNREEAYDIVKDNPKTFLRIDRPETSFSKDTSMYSDEVYAKAKELLQKDIENGTYIKDQQPCYYLYELTMGNRSQTGIVGCGSIDDYLNNVIKKHENTRKEKEQDRIRHVDTCNAQTGPIFLACRDSETLDQIFNQIKQQAPIYDFVSKEDIGQRCWKISDQEIMEKISKFFKETNQLYIADGHHRAASAVQVGLNRREQMGTYTGQEEFNFFLSVVFPKNQLQILPYYRVVKDTNGLSKEEFFDKIKSDFEITNMNHQAVEPQEPLSFGCFIDNQWYLLKAKPHIYSNDPVKGLDVAILQDYLLNPILGIKDPTTDSRIDFVGGIRGVKELEKRCHEDMQIAFSTYPTSMEQLFNVADANLLMPPKSTWFEPKLYSGLFIHEL